MEKIEDLPTLYSVDLLNMDTCRNELLMEDVRNVWTKNFIGDFYHFVNH